jgi:hypothetical protein
LVAELPEATPCSLSPTVSLIHKFVIPMLMRFCGDGVNTVPWTARPLTPLPTHSFTKSQIAAAARCHFAVSTPFNAVSSSQKVCELSDPKICIQNRSRSAELFASDKISSRFVKQRCYCGPPSRSTHFVKAFFPIKISHCLTAHVTCNSTREAVTLKYGLPVPADCTNVALILLYYVQIC